MEYALFNNEANTNATAAWKSKGSTKKWERKYQGGLMYGQIKKRQALNIKQNARTWSAKKE